MKYGSSAEIFAKMRLMQILKKDHKKVDIIRDPGLHVCACCEQPTSCKVADATQQRLRTGQPRVQLLYNGFYLCGVCTQVFISDENSISRSECQLWFHTLCVNESSDNDTFWMCPWGTDMET